MIQISRMLSKEDFRLDCKHMSLDFRHKSPLEENRSDANVINMINVAPTIFLLGLTMMASVQTDLSFPCRHIVMILGMMVKVSV